MIAGLDLEPEAQGSFSAPREEAETPALCVVKGAIILIMSGQEPSQFLKTQVCIIPCLDGLSSPYVLGLSGVGDGTEETC